MPLPAALAAKLAKRGLVSAPKPSDKENTSKESKVALACPNKYNIYHDCTTWCQMHWKIQSTPEPRYLKNIRKLLEKYPLPKNCTELFDAGIGRYYYWDMEKNLVSWLPPSHPKSVQSEPAAKLRQKLKDPHEDQEVPRSESEKKRDKHRERRDKEREERRHRHEDRDRGRKRSKRDDLDPMDPAAYSDIPRGTWSDGLETNKSKADTTASGALFQQRPYPSPGDVLEANKQKSAKKK